MADLQVHDPELHVEPCQPVPIRSVLTYGKPMARPVEPSIYGNFMAIPRLDITNDMGLLRDR